MEKTDRLRNLNIAMMWVNRAMAASWTLCAVYLGLVDDEPARCLFYAVLAVGNSIAAYISQWVVKDMDNTMKRIEDYEARAKEPQDEIPEGWRW